MCSSQTDTHRLLRKRGLPCDAHDPRVPDNGPLPEKRVRDEKNATPYTGPTGVFGLFGPEVHLGVSERVSPKIGVRPEVSLGSALQVWALKSVPRVSFYTLLNTFWAGAQRVPGAHPAFREHSLRHFVGDFGPEGPGDSCRGSRLSQGSGSKNPHCPHTGWRRELSIFPVFPRRKRRGTF